MSVQAREIGVWPVVSSLFTAWPNALALYGPEVLLTQLIGEAFLQMAGQADIMYRCSGSDHALTGSNIWSATAQVPAEAPYVGGSAAAWDPSTPAGVAPA